ncbi:MAG: hypothetical protein ACK465_06760, partial [Flavobacteriia bacterium]
GSTQTYSVTDVAGVTETWSFPTGWVITSGQGTSTVTVTVGSNNGTISVTPSIGACVGPGQTASTAIPNYRWKYISSNLGSSTWTAGEARNLSITIQNTGLATWNSAYANNIGVRWNSTTGTLSGTPWTDYHSRVTVGSLAPGATGTFTLPIQAKNATPGPVYGTNLANGTYYLAFDLVSEGQCWFANNTGTCGPGNTVFYSSAQTVSTIPTLACSTLSSFGNVCTNATAVNSFTISGVNLTNDISVAAVTGYTYSTSINGTYTSTLTLPQVSGSVPSTTIFVKFTPTAATTYNGPIVVSSTGATSQNVSVSGTGIAAPIVNAGSDVTICNGSSTTLVGSTNATSITGSASATYTAGNGSTLYSTGPTTSTNSSCPLNLSVSIPVNAVINGVNVTYNMTSPSSYGGYMSEQVSYLKCTNLGGANEASTSVGVGSFSGTMNYNRTNLTLANSVVGGGVINFQLHAFRTWGGSGCEAFVSYVENNTFTITVNYTIPVINTWSPSTGLNSTTSLTPIASPTTTTTYTLTSTSANGCSSSDQVQVTVLPLPTQPTVSTAGSYCNSTTLTAANGGSGTMYFQGTTSGGTSTATPSTSQLINTSGTYYFRAYNGTCWGNEGSATVVINTQPVITLQPSSNSETKCQNSQSFTPLSVTATGTNLTYQWYSNTTASTSGGTLIAGATSASYTPSNATVGILYYYCVVSSASCPSTTSGISGAMVVIGSPSAPTVSAASTTINVGGSAIVTGTLGTTGNTLAWYATAPGGTAIALNNTPVDETIFNTANIPLNFCTPGTTTTYYLEETNVNNGCPSVRTPFTITTNPISTSSPANLLICQTGGSVTMTANVVPSSTTPITWTSSSTGAAPWANVTPATNPSILTVSPNATTHYQLAAITPMGCSNSITFPTFQVGVLNPLNFTPTATPSSVCVGETSALVANTPSGTFSVTTIPVSTSATSGTVNVLCNACFVDDGSWNNIPMPFTYNFFGNNYN